jgi:hypothetical protein
MMQACEDPNGSGNQVNSQRQGTAASSETSLIHKAQTAIWRSTVVPPERSKSKPIDAPKWLPRHVQ